MPGKDEDVSKPADLKLVGKTTRNFYQRRCTAINPTECGFQTGAELFFETDPHRGIGFKITASSVQINHSAVEQVEPGQQCAVQIGTHDLPHTGTLVFVVN